jgi:hypothetical protein
MKHVKMLGLTVVAAAALMAFVGAGTASASGRLCSTETNPCTSPWTTPTALDFSLKSGGSAKLTDTAGNTLDTCTSSTVKGSLTNNAAGTTPSGPISELAWGGCTVTTDTILPGGLKIASAGSGAGTVSSNAKIEVTVNVFSSCNYGVESGTTLGTTNKGTGSNVVFKANAVAKKLAGGFLCPETTKWVAEYVLTTPSNTLFYVSTS